MQKWRRVETNGLSITGRIRNLGAGFADNIHLHVIREGHNDERVLQIPALASGDMFRLDDRTSVAEGPILLPALRRNQPYHCLLSYTNMFGEVAWISGDSTDGTASTFATSANIRPGVYEPEVAIPLSERATETYRSTSGNHVDLAQAGGELHFPQFTK